LNHFAQKKQWRNKPMNKQWAAYQNSQAFAARVATLYGAGESVLSAQKDRYGPQGC
jgi:hypothetical protein